MSGRRNRVPVRPAPESPGPPRFACATFDFIPSVKEELQLDVGDVVKIIRKVDDFWQFGLKLHSGEKGQFPRDFVRNITLPKHTSNESLLYALDAFYPEAEGDLAFDKGEIVILEQKINNEWGTGRCRNSSSRGMFPLNYTGLLPMVSEKAPTFESQSIENGYTQPPTVENGLGTAKAIMNLTAQLDDELSFNIGDEITITEVMDDGSWYRGCLGKSTGTFPASFVQLLTPLKTTETVSQREKPFKVSLNRTGSKAWKEEELDPITPKSVIDSNSYYDHAANASTEKQCDELKEEKNDHIVAQHDNYSEKPNQKDLGDVHGGSVPSEEGADQGPVLYTVTAAYKFTKNTEQELSFEKGTEILIYKEVDEHWLMGKIGENKGYVARAYVLKKECLEKVEEKLQAQDDKDKIMPKSSAVEKEKSETSSVGYVRKTGESLNLKHHVYSGPVSTPSNTKSNKSTDHDQVKVRQGKRASALYDYRASEKFDISVTRGEIVWAIKDVDSNWVEIRNESGKKGIVPTSFIQYIEKEEDTDDHHRDEQSDGSSQPIDSKSNEVPNEIGDVKKVTAEYTFATTNQPSMPVLHEHTVSDNKSRDVQKTYYTEQANTDSVSLPSHSHKPSNLPIYKGVTTDNYQNSLKKSISVDSGNPMTSNDKSNTVNRSNSNPRNRNITAHDAREILKAWCASRRANAPVNPENSSLPQMDDGETSSNSSEAPSSRKSSFKRGSSRSLSMREKRTPRRQSQVTSKDTDFIKVRSDSDLPNEASLKRQRHKTVSGIKMKQIPRQLNGNSQLDRTALPMKAKHVDSASTASTGSTSSYGESRSNNSAQSELPDFKSRSQRSANSRNSARRSAPPVPPHGMEKASTPEDMAYPLSPWSPPVPTRKQSLQHMQVKPVADVPPPPPDISLIPTRTMNFTPSRPAPQLPPSRTRTTSKLSTTSPLSPKKKVPPMRPANPPQSRRLNTKTPNGSTQERVRRVTSRDMKDRIEKLRSDIEEYSRMKTDLENLYQSTLDGRERRGISENMEFVKANLRRLQKEFHDLIEGQQDHIYESLEQHLRPRPMNEYEATEGLRAPSLPPIPDSPGSIRQKRRDKRLLVVTELVNTERIFLNDVTITVEDIMNELIDRQISQNSISILFANITQVKDFSTKLLRELEDALRNESSVQPDYEGATIGQVFIDFNAEMKEVYTPYYRNHDDAMALLEKLHEDQEFSQAVQYCLDNIKSKVNVFDLGSFLIKPVQRFLKYPLLIEELIKLTDAATPDQPSDHDKLILAHKMMQSIAKEINEDKRKIDLVRKYKDASSEGISDKLGKLNLKSIKKKSGRLSTKLGRVAGITTDETRDRQFDEVERRFKLMERAVKLFVQNVTSYCDKCRDVLCSELVVAHVMVDMVIQPESSHPVAMFEAVAEKMSGPIYRQFHDQVQLQVLSPISSLIQSFRSPQTIIDKRLDKLIDYDRLKKSSESKEKVQAAQHDYEALNKSLLDELPKLCDLGLRLVTSCTAIFAKVHRDFENKLLKELEPLLHMIEGNADSDLHYPNNMATYEKFRPEYTEAIHTISRLQVVPSSFGAIFGSARGASESHRRSTTSNRSSQKRVTANSTLKQPLDDREGLKQKYQPQQLYVATKSYNASQLMDISCCEGDLVAVLKQGDPMGTRERWFVDRGGPGNSTGFLPSSLLKLYDPSRDDCLITLEPKEDTLSNSTSRQQPSAESSPMATQRQKSPTPSIRSHSSGDSGSSSGARKSPVAPHVLRDTLKQGTLPSKEDGTPFTDADMLEAFAEEDEIFDDTEYGEIESNSPRPVKQHFRAEYDFTARTDIELSLHAGNIVSLIVAHDSDGNSDWWFVGNAEGRQGYVPANYLTKAEYL